MPHLKQHFSLICCRSARPLPKGISHANPYACPAEAIVQTLGCDITENKTYAIESGEGDGPGSDRKQWQALFKAAT